MNRTNIPSHPLPRLIVKNDKIPRMATNLRLVFQKTEGRCYYCGCVLDPFTFHFEHCKPLCAGGTHDFDNVVPACPKCNASKDGRCVDEWRISLQRRVTLPLDKAVEWVCKQPHLSDEQQRAFIGAIAEVQASFLAVPLLFWFEKEG